jgi:hypothetical protein
MKWISIKERMPKNDAQKVLLLWNLKSKTFCMIGFWNFVIKKWEIHRLFESNCFINKNRISHWMPLPKNPRGK